MAPSKKGKKRGHYKKYLWPGAKYELPRPTRHRHGQRKDEEYCSSHGSTSESEMEAEQDAVSPHSLRHGTTGAADGYAILSLPADDERAHIQLSPSIPNASDFAQCNMTLISDGSDSNSSAAVQIDEGELRFSPPDTDDGEAPSVFDIDAELEFPFDPADLPSDVSTSSEDSMDFFEEWEVPEQQAWATDPPSQESRFAHLFNEAVTEKVVLSKGDILLMFLKHALKTHMSLTAMTDLAQMINLMFDKPVLPQSRYMLGKMLSGSETRMTFYFFCPNCNVRIGQAQSNSSLECPKCNHVTKISALADAPFFVLLDVPSQVQKLLKGCPIFST